MCSLSHALSIYKQGLLAGALPRTPGPIEGTGQDSDKQNKENIQNTSHFSGVSFPTLKRVVAAALAAAKSGQKSVKKRKSAKNGSSD